MINHDDILGVYRFSLHNYYYCQHLFWNCVLNLQLLSEELGIKYAWTTVLDLHEYGESPFKFVDQSKFIQPTGMIKHLADQGFVMTNEHFPTQAHEVWSKIIKS